MKYEKHIQKLTEIFCDKNKQKKYSKPLKAKEENFWLATDAHVMVLIPCELIGTPDEEISTKFLSSAPALDTPIRTSIADLKKALEPLDCKEGYDSTYEECPNAECEDGGVECGHCGHETDCDDCEGNGQVLLTRIPNGIKEYNQYDYVKMGEGVFSPNIINRAIAGIETLELGEGELIITHNSARKQTEIKVDDVRFILMPSLVTDSAELHSTVIFSSPT